MPKKAENKELMRKVFESINGRDRKTFRAIHSKNVKVHAPNGRIQGIDDVEDVEFGRFEAFPDMKFTPMEMIAEGDMVAGLWKVQGTHKGRFEGVPATGKKVEIMASGLFRIEDGKVSEVWLNFDRLGMMQQLGALEAPTA